MKIVWILFKCDIHWSELSWLACYLFIISLSLSFFLFWRLYRSIGEYDVLRGIFGSELGTKQDTRNALLAEARSDYSEAAKLYNEVKPISGKYISSLNTLALYI